MTVMSPSPMNAPSIVSPSSTVRQITSATGQEEQVDFIVSLGCENGRGNSSIFHPRLTYTPTSPRRENTHLRTLNTEEPLIDAIRRVRSAGYGVGLHTGGAYPTRLAAILPLVDWVGLDIKAMPDQFDAITRTRGGALPAFRSLDLVLESGVDVQVRTTVDPTVMGEDDVARLTVHLA